MSVNEGDVLRVTAVMNWAAETQVENVFYFRFEGLLPIADDVAMLDCATKLEAMYTHILPELHVSLTFIEVQGFNHTQNRPMPTISWPTLTAGSGSGAPQATGVSFLGLLRTGVKRCLSRKFFGVISNGSLASGQFTAGALADLATALAELLGTFVGAESGVGWLPGVLRKTGAFLEFIDAHADSVPAYQRRRRQGRGI